MERPPQDLRINAHGTNVPRRALAIVVVAVIHVAIIYALATGLATSVIQKSVKEIKVAVEHPNLDKEAPPPPPDLAKPPPTVVPPPEIVVQQPAPAAVPIVPVHP